MAVRGWGKCGSAEDEVNSCACCGAILVGTRVTLVPFVRLVVTDGTTSDFERRIGGGLLHVRVLGAVRVSGTLRLVSVVVTVWPSGRELPGGATVTTPPPTTTLAPGSWPIPGTQVREDVTVLR